MCLQRIIKGVVFAGMIMTATGLSAQNPTDNARQAPVQKLTLTGKITDATTHKPIVGASVSVSGLSAAITDDKGEFSLNVGSYTDDIIITAEGYGTRQIALKQRQRVEVSLQDDALPSYQEKLTMPFSSIQKRELSASASLYNEDAA
ncbi:MAG TPA: carboxypeptidase-like regulatory domain-containing protein, partial [Chitinophagaceae bacterium]